MGKRNATEIFSEWVLSGKDEGMEINHAAAVNHMIEELVGTRTLPFSIIDAGCGNGWVVRKIANHPLCERAIGVDGSSRMIEKAKSLNSKGDYYLSDLLEWYPNEKVDFVHSMEVLYYFKDPKKLINHILNHWIIDGGTIIMGMDHYHENFKSHSWATDLNTYMKLLSIKDWIKLFKDCGVRELKSFQTNETNKFPGTLVIKGKKVKTF